MFGNDGTTALCCESDDFVTSGVVAPIQIITAGQTDYVKLTWSVGGYQWEDEVIADLGDCDDGPYCEYFGSDYDTDCGGGSGEHPCDNVDVGIGAWGVHASAGDDLIRVSLDTDTCTTAAYYGDDGNDKIMGGRADAHHYGGAGDDVIYGFYGDDYCYGGEGSDWIDCGVGDDLLWGNADDGFGDDVQDGVPDYLCGGLNSDVIRGGGDYSGEGDECADSSDTRTDCEPKATCGDLTEDTAPF